MSTRPHTSRPFGLAGLVKWQRLNITCWDRQWWDQHIHDDEHLRLVLESTDPPAYKLLYDSYLWAQVLRSVQAHAVLKVLELLPGSSLTIPLALQSIGFRGLLTQIDRDQMQNELRCATYRVHRVSADVLTENHNYSEYDAIVGNHIIDDLIIGQEYRDLSSYKSIYYNQSESVSAWAKLAASNRYEEHVRRITDYLLVIFAQMKKGAHIILREYPATFALQTGDLTRIRASLCAYHRVVQELARAPRSDFKYARISHMAAAPGSKYPRSYAIVGHR